MPSWADGCSFSLSPRFVPVSVLVRLSEAVQAITDLDGTLTQLGLAGWELVSSTQVVQRTPVEAFYFKRPLQV